MKFNSRRARLYYPNCHYKAMFQVPRENTFYSVGDEASAQSLDFFTHIYHIIFTSGGYISSGGHTGKDAYIEINSHTNLLILKINTFIALLKMFL